tara:strand:- start:174 stop:647 length:474 start_codon:yes stop_codon:yes gene_type:complete
MSDNLGIFIGNVGRDAELKEVGKDNTLVLNFSIAVATGYGKKKTTHWVQCAIWGDRAEKLEQHITKGKRVLVKGEVTPDAYENKDNEIVAQMRINVSDFSFGGDSSEGGGGNRDDDDNASGRSRSRGRASEGRSRRPSSRDEPEDEGMSDRDEIPFD